MKLVRIIGYLVLTAFAVSCGESSDSELSEREFKQDIRYISYLLKNARVEIQLNSAAGSTERTVKELNFAPDEAKDKVERFIDGPDFALKVNGEKAEIKISSNGNIAHTMSVQSGNAACSLRGTSTLNGRAMALNLQLEWVLDVEIQGDQCGDTVKSEYSGFVQREIDALRFLSVKDLIAAADRPFTNAKRLQIRLNIQGEGR